MLIPSFISLLLSSPIAIFVNLNTMGRRKKPSNEGGGYLIFERNSPLEINFLQGAFQEKRKRENLDVRSLTHISSNVFGVSEYCLILKGIPCSMVLLILDFLFSILLNIGYCPYLVLLLLFCRAASNFEGNCPVSVQFPLFAVHIQLHLKLVYETDYNELVDW